MQAALYDMYRVGGGKPLCDMLLLYVRSPTQPAPHSAPSAAASKARGVSPVGRKTAGMSATTLEHKIRRLSLFLKLAQAQHAATTAPADATADAASATVNLLDRHHSVWGKLHVAVHGQVRTPCMTRILPTDVGMTYGPHSAYM